MLTSLSFGACQFVYVETPDVQFRDPLPGQGLTHFEMRSESGFFMWGERWSSDYAGAAFQGPALARSILVDGKPFVDFVPAGDEVSTGRVMDQRQKPLRVPLIDLIAVAPQAVDSNPNYVEDLLEFIAGLHKSRLMH
jgi:hypothetical protein